MFPPLNLSSLLTSSANRVSQFPTITTSAVLQNGSPLIALSSGSTYSYDGELNAWIKLSSPWFNKSDFWDGRRGKAGNGGRGTVKGVETAINEMLVESGYTDGKSDDEEEVVPETVENTSSATEQGAETRRRKKQKTIPSGEEESEVGNEDTFRAALSLGHLEARLAAAIATGSPAEYKVFLATYAKKLADEGIQNKAEELVRDLMGPIYLFVLRFLSLTVSLTVDMVQQSEPRRCLVAYGTLIYETRSPEGRSQHFRSVIDPRQVMHG